MTYLRLLLLAWAAFLMFVGPARAETKEKAAVDLVCVVAHALKQPWSADRCQAVAAALATTREPKTMLAVAVLESDMRPHAVAWHGRHLVDVGLMGIRCRLGARRTCQNGPARGLTPAQLANPVTSVMVAEDIMQWKRARVGKRRALAAYAGDADGRSGRVGDVRALVAAFAGVELPVKKARVRELVRRIAAAVRRERRS
jgi:hypothetical protein